MNRSIFICLLSAFLFYSANAQIVIDRKADCNLQWEYVDWGHEMGEYNNILPFDYGLDGTIELIVNDRYDSFLSDDGYSWSVLKYDSLRNTYELVYTSPRYQFEINRMILQDLDNDGIPELLLNENDNLHIINVHTHETLRTIALQNVGFTPFYLVQIRFGDVDNDGQNEIIVGGSDGLSIINANTFEIERHLNEDADQFDVGNVDNDPAIEIAFKSGKVWEIHGTSITSEYTFRNPQGNTQYDLLELEDIDNDGKEEAVMYVSSDSLRVFDIDIQGTKYVRFIDTRISAMIITDVQGDGVKEILYACAGEDDFYCVRASTGAALWKIENPYANGLGIALADIDQDGGKEILWTNNSTYGVIQVYDAVTRTKEWTNHPSGSPYYGIEIADIDADQEPELIMISSLQGDLRIFDAITKEIEYQSSTDLFPKPIRGTYNIVIGDYLSDGDLDIMIGSDQNGNGALFVIDGDNHAIETSHIYGGGNPTTIVDLEYADLDEDGVKEFIALSGSRAYVINSITKQILWTSEVFGNSGDLLNDLIIGNTDFDHNHEIIVCKDHLMIYDNDTYVKTQSAYDQYESALLYDWNQDGRNEVIATGDGIIHILETDNLTIVEEFHYGFEPITGLDTIHLDHTGVPAFIATAGSRIIFFTADGTFVASQKIVKDLGNHDALVVTDVNADGLDEVFIGTERGLFQLNTQCATCLLFNPVITYVDPHCNEDNGEIQIQAMDTSATYFANGDLFESPLSGLSSDEFQLVMENQHGCHFEAEIQLEDHDLRGNAYAIPRSCFGGDDGKALIQISEGTPPYSLQWSNGGNTDTIVNLSLGVYHVTLIDSFGCVFMDSVHVRQDTVFGTLVINKPACRGVDDGKATLNIQHGVFPFEFNWDGMPGLFQNDSLSKGMHTVVVSDAFGCSTTYHIDIPETFDEVSAELLIPSCNGLPTGTLVANVLAGNPPYTYVWTPGGSNTAQLNNLMPGSYIIALRDSKKCFAYDTIEVPYHILTADLIFENVSCYGGNDGSALLTSINGSEPYVFSWTGGVSDSLYSQLSTGIYALHLEDSTGCSIDQGFTITSPDSIHFSFEITADNAQTPEPEGSILVTITGGTPPFMADWSTGEHTPNISQLYSGQYQLTVIDEHGCEKSAIVEVPLSTSTNSPDKDPILVYPNPVKDKLHISWAELDKRDINIKIIGVDGKILTGLNSEDHVNLRVFDTYALPPGIYAVLLTKNNTCFTKKFVITR